MNNTCSRLHFEINKFAQVKGKNSEKASKLLYPFSLSLSLEIHFLISLSLEIHFLTIVLVPVALIKSNKKQPVFILPTGISSQRKIIGLESLQSNLVLIRVYSQYSFCFLVFENDVGLTLFIQQMMIIMSLNVYVNQQGFFNEYLYIKFLYQKTSFIYHLFVEQWLGKIYRDRWHWNSSQMEGK